MDPAIPLSACVRAAWMSRWRTNSRNATATSTIMIGPPMNSASVNCQVISNVRMMPSSMTRLVLAISKVIAAMKLAPRRNSDLARATAAYEQDEDAAPKAVATASVFGLSSPSSRTTVCRRTTACTIADRVKPRISDQVTCQVIDPARLSAWPMASTTRMSSLPGSDGQQLAQAMLQERMRETVGKPVKRHPAVLAERDESGEAQHLERVRHLVIVGI